MKAAFLATFLLFSTMCFAQAPSGGLKPLTREQLVRLVAAGMDNEQLTKTLAERGIGFELTVEDLQNLRKKGAQPELLKAVAEAGLAYSREPLNKDMLSHLVGAGADSAKLAQAVQERGIDSALSSEDLDGLKQLGANEALLRALREANPRPLNSDQVLKLVTGGVARERAATLVKRRGVDFNPTDEYMETLRIAGADEELLQTIRDSRPTPGMTIANDKDGLKYVWIPPGTFKMGCSRGDSQCKDIEKPAHRVAISKGFWMAQTEVTVGAYKRFAAAGRQMPSAPSFNSGWGNDAMPIVEVNWDDATAYCTWAGGRLPTEAEWEYAARAGSTEARYGPLDEVAWYKQNSGGQAHVVAQKRANTFGLFDMLGNVREWVSDWYGEDYYQGRPASDPQGPGSGLNRVVRGGSWGYLSRYVRASNRYGNNPGFRNDAVGFRCVKEVLP